MGPAETTTADRTRIPIGTWLVPLLGIVLFLGTVIVSWPEPKPHDPPLAVFTLQTGGRAGAAAVSPDGRISATAEKGGRITLREIDSGKVLHSLSFDESSSKEVGSLRFTGDGGYLVASDVRLVDWYTWQRSVAPMFRIHDARTGLPAGGFLGLASTFHWRILNDRRSIAMLGSKEPRKIRFGRRDFRGEPIGNDKDIELPRGSGDINFAAISPNGEKLALGGFQLGRLYLFDTTDGKLIGEISDRPGSLGMSFRTSAEFSPDGNRLAAAHERSIELLDLSNLKSIWDRKAPATDFVQAVRFSEDGTKLAHIGYSAKPNWLTRNVIGWLGLHAGSDVSSTVGVLDAETGASTGGHVIRNAYPIGIDTSTDGRTTASTLSSLPAAAIGPNSSASTEVRIWRENP